MKSKDITDEGLLKPLLADDTCKKLLLELCYTIEPGEIGAPKELPLTIDEVYWILCALYGN